MLLRFTGFLNSTALFAWIDSLPWSRPGTLAASLLNKKDDVFNILWVLVFGFATLNILGLVSRRFEPERNRLSFGETIAIMVVLVSVVLLGWEMLNIFKIFPIKLKPR
jgi:hypothetical protein